MPSGNRIYSATRNLVGLPDYRKTPAKKKPAKLHNLPEAYGSFGPIWPYSAEGFDYWAALEAFNAGRERAARHETA